MLKQTVRSQLIKHEYHKDYLYILDGVVSVKRSSDKHWQVIREVMQLPAVKVVEHPDVFVQHSEYTLDDFDYFIELRNNEDEEITYEKINKPEFDEQDGFSMFDFE